jgi:hypothetical protein
MPFTALVQRQFASRTVAQAQDAFAIGKTRGIAISSARKRRLGHTKENGLGQHQSGHPLCVDRAQTPAWVRHLYAFRHRSFCSAATTTRVLDPSKRPLRTSMIKLAAGPVATQARQCNTSAQHTKEIEKLVHGNKAFREQMLKINPSFFEESAKGQSM